MVPIKKQPGFTIVELLIVVVVIAILAAITIVAYNGIQNRAKQSSVQSAVGQANKKVLTYAVVNADQYPANLAAADMVESSATYQYTVNNSATPRMYCVTATIGAISYYLSNTVTTPTSGACAGHGEGGVATITNMILNPSIETNTSSTATAAGGVAVARDTTQAFSGVASFRAITDGTVSGSGTQLLTTTGTYAPGNYRASVYVKGTAGAQLYGVLRATGSGGGDAVTPTTTLTGVWQRFELPVLTVTSSTTTQFSLMVRTVAMTATTFWVDGAMLVEGSNIYTYADGNTPGWAWTGATNSSTSIGMPK